MTIWTKSMPNKPFWTIVQEWILYSEMSWIPVETHHGPRESELLVGLVLIPLTQTTLICREQRMSSIVALLWWRTRGSIRIYTIPWKMTMPDWLGRVLSLGQCLNWVWHGLEYCTAWSWGLCGLLEFPSCTWCVSSLSFKGFESRANVFSREDRDFRKSFDGYHALNWLVLLQAFHFEWLGYSWFRLPFSHEMESVILCAETKEQILEGEGDGDSRAHMVMIKSFVRVDRQNFSSHWDNLKIRWFIERFQFKSTGDEIHPI